MPTTTERPLEPGEVEDFVWEVVRTGVILSDLLAGMLEDMADDAFPGEEPGLVLIEMLAGTIAPAATAAGATTVRGARALMGALVDRTLDDLRAALEIARERESND